MHPPLCEALWLPEHSGTLGNDIADELSRRRGTGGGGPLYQFVGPEPALGFSKHNIKENIKCLLVNQHRVLPGRKDGLEN